MERTPPVVFDWHGALRLARLLWNTADDLDRLASERRTRASETLINWTGTYGDQFAARIDDELQQAAAIANQLRVEAAEGWAVEWKHAMDQENWNRYQAACDRVRDDRDWKDDLKGVFGMGHDDLPPEPSMADVPSPPGFAPTRRFATY